MVKDWQAVNGIPGPEDLELDTVSVAARPRQKVSSQRRPGTNGGAIFAVPLENGQFGAPSALPLQGRDPRIPFHPHGINLVATERLLYVINHAGQGRHLIEVFDIRELELAYRRTLPETPLLVSPNDLAALPGSDVYVTNDRGKKGLLGIVEALFGPHWSNVIHFRDGMGWQLATEGIGFANGIAINGSGDRVYVGATRERLVHIFARDPSSGRLTPPPQGGRSSIAVGSGVDNLSWEEADSSGEWLDLAAHPSLLAFIAYAKGIKKRSPSQAFRVNVVSGEVQQVFDDDGSAISAASTALRFRGRWYLGQVFGDEVVSFTT